MKTFAKKFLFTILLSVIFQNGSQAQNQPWSEFIQFESNTHSVHLDEQIHRFNVKISDDLTSTRFYPFTQQSNFEDKVQTAWIRNCAAGLAPTVNLATAVAVDDSGNIYVTGGSTKLPFGYDFLTVKYSPSGQQLWVARYENDGNGDSGGSAIAIDASGNIYVTGSSVKSGTGSNYTTVKYNSAGVEQWVTHYNGTANLNDGASAIAVDHSGNVYVTGVSIGSGTDQDFATLKYNSAGIEQWVARYHGPEDRDRAVAIAVDLSGNVYVTGESDGSGSDRDYATVKYNSAGIEQWVARYDGPIHSDDRVSDIGVDNSGNVYVTGSSRDQDTETDYATVKYNSSGKQQWVVRYNGSGDFYDYANALALDNLGNVYVTGESLSEQTEEDFVTIKYNSSGIQQWIASYDGPGDSYDGAYHLVIDKEGNVYVAGGSAGPGIRQDYVMVKYNAAGIEQWVACYDGPESGFDRVMGLAVDAQGNVIATGYSINPETDESKYATIKYNANGVRQWVTPYKGPGNTAEHTSALVIDGSGNIIVSGCSHKSGSSYDFAVVKYNAQGEELWMARYDSPIHEEDHTYALTVDGQDNIYVVGRSEELNTEDDYTIVKYNSAGQEQWVARYNGPASDYDKPNALVTDSAGNLYVTGGSAGLGTSHDFATVKYNSAGEEQWVARYDGTGSDYDEANALAVDATGNVYVTGESWDPNKGKYNYVTIKYNSAGIEEWAVHYDGPENDFDLPNDLAIDTEGSVYVTGRSTGSGTDYDYATVKYNSAGEEQWVSRYNGPGNSGDEAVALEIDNSGNVYVTGSSEGTDSEDDYATVKYNSAGEEQWVARYNGAGNENDEATAITLDKAGNVYVTGKSEGLGTNDDYVTIKYNSAGEEQWITRYDGPANASNEATAMAIDASDNIYVTGNTGGGVWEMMTTIKYTQSPVNVKDSPNTSKPEMYCLSQNYPNPFNPATTITFQIRKPGLATLIVYDMLGKEVETLINEYKPAGTHKIQFDANNHNLTNGVYFYKIQIGKVWEETKKMILLK